jgi:hypothetical protein
MLLDVRSQSATKIGSQVASATSRGDTVTKYLSTNLENSVGQIVGTTVFNLTNSLQQLRRVYLIKRALAEQWKDIGVETVLDVDSIMRHPNMLLFAEPLKGYRLERVFCRELFTQVRRFALSGWVQVRFELLA